MAHLLHLAEATFSHIGIMGLAAVWGIKAALGWIVLRWWRLRRGGSNIGNG